MQTSRGKEDNRWWCENCHKLVRVVGGEEGTYHWHCDYCNKAVNAYQNPAPPKQEVDER